MGGKDDQKEMDSFVEDDTTDSETDTSRGPLRRKRTTDPEVHLRNRRQKLNDQIAKDLGLESDGNRPLIVAVIGAPGVGKSSSINTMIAAMSDDRYREYAMSGMFNNSNQMTYLTNSFPKEKYMKSRTTDVCYPTFVDIAGFMNEDTEKNEELLRIVFYGRLPVEDSLKEAEEHYKEDGLNGLRKKYSQNLEMLKVDRVIVVASADENIPENLINCVIRAANPAGAKAARGKQTIPVFGILTKTDTVDLNSEEFCQREDKFIGCMGLIGAKQRYARIINYCSNVDKEDERLEGFLPKLDVPMLKFLRQVLDPVYEVQARYETYDDITKAQSSAKEPETVGETTNNTQQDKKISEKHQMETGLQPLGPQTPSIPLMVTYAVKGILIAIFVYLCMSPAISNTEVVNICSHYDTHQAKYQHSGSGVFTSPDLAKVCARKHNIINRSQMVPLVLFVLFIVFLDFFLPRFVEKILNKTTKPKTD